MSKTRNKSVFVPKKANFEKLGCQNSLAIITLMLTYTAFTYTTTTLKCPQMTFRKKMVLKLFNLSERGNLKSTPGLNRGNKK